MAIISKKHKKVSKKTILSRIANLKERLAANESHEEGQEVKTRRNRLFFLFRLLRNTNLSKKKNKKSKLSRIENLKLDSPIKQIAIDYISSVERNSEHGIHATSPVKLKKTQSIIPNQNESALDADTSITSLENSPEHNDSSSHTSLIISKEESYCNCVSELKTKLFSNEEQLVSNEQESVEKLMQENNSDSDESPILFDTDILVSPSTSNHSFLQNQASSSAAKTPNVGLSEISFDSDLDCSKLSFGSQSTPTKRNALKEWKNVHINEIQDNEVEKESLVEHNLDIHSTFMHDIVDQSQNATIEVSSIAPEQIESSEFTQDGMQLSEICVLMNGSNLQTDIISEEYVQDKNIPKYYEIIALSTPKKENTQLKKKSFKTPSTRNVHKTPRTGRKMKDSQVFDRLLDVNNFTGMYRQRFISRNVKENTSDDRVISTKRPLTYQEKRIIKRLTEIPQRSEGAFQNPISNSHNPCPILKLRV